jgi:hypothetical protein
MLSLRVVTSVFNLEQDLRADVRINDGRRDTTRH